MEARAPASGIPSDGHPRRRGGLEHFEQRIFSGMEKNGYDREFALQIFEQIRKWLNGAPASRLTPLGIRPSASSGWPGPPN